MNPVEHFFFMGGGPAITIPIILMILLTISFWRDGERFQPGLCQQCGYDLTGNRSGICPECGTRI